ncbi:MAG TPA: hypothetical protein VK934_04050 [Fimbriimonas sp.]|nr:hypothetical protein [Fimbriimonas sp.]
MTQEQAIALAERAITKMPSSKVFAIPFTNRRDYDRAQDAFTDMGCPSGDDVALSDPPSLNPACRSLKRLRAESSGDMEVYVLEVAVPPTVELRLLDSYVERR